jgi:hypothetical protein
MDLASPRSCKPIALAKLIGISPPGGLEWWRSASIVTADWRPNGLSTRKLTVARLSESGVACAPAGLG